MSELEDKLNSLLSNQDAMAQVMQLAQSLSVQERRTAGALHRLPRRRAEQRLEMPCRVRAT